MSATDQIKVWCQSCGLGLAKLFRDTCPNCGAKNSAIDHLPAQYDQGTATTGGA